MTLLLRSIDNVCKNHSIWQNITSLLLIVTTVLCYTTGELDKACITILNFCDSWKIKVCVQIDKWHCLANCMFQCKYQVTKGLSSWRWIANSTHVIWLYSTVTVVQTQQYENTFDEKTSAYTSSKMYIVLLSATYSIPLHLSDS